MNSESRVPAPDELGMQKGLYSAATSTRLLVNSMLFYVSFWNMCSGTYLSVVLVLVFFCFELDFFYLDCLPDMFLGGECRC